MNKFKAGMLLRQMARLHDRLQRDNVAYCGTTPTQCQIITTLGRAGPMTLADLGRSLGLDKGWVSRAVESLARDGLLIKGPGEADRRTISLTLSGEGGRRLAELDATLNGLSERVMQRIPARQRASVYAALGLLRDALLAESQPAMESVPASTDSRMVSKGVIAEHWFFCWRSGSRCSPVHLPPTCGTLREPRKDTQPWTSALFSNSSSRGMIS